jgi:hypothetical protein
VVAWAQLAALGVTAREVQVRIAAGRLHRIHRGVYGVVGDKLLRREGRWLAAVFAVGEGAVLTTVPPGPSGASCPPRGGPPRSRRLER